MRLVVKLLIAVMLITTIASCKKVRFTLCKTCVADNFRYNQKIVSVKIDGRDYTEEYLAQDSTPKSIFVGFDSYGGSWSNQTKSKDDFSFYFKTVINDTLRKAFFGAYIKLDYNKFTIVSEPDIHVYEPYIKKDIPKYYPYRDIIFNPLVRDYEIKKASKNKVIISYQFNNKTVEIKCE